MTKIILTILAVATFSTYVHADGDDGYVGYDQIVAQLKASAAAEPAPKPETLDWDQVALHGGVGLATAYLNTTAPNGVVGSGLLKGLEISAGMNLFTSKARAEAAFRTYAQESFSHDMQAQLHELELSLVFLPPLNDNTSLRMGFGFAARYLDMNTRANGLWTNYQSSTPSSVLLLGFEHRIATNLTVGPDVSYRSAMIHDSFDKSGLDASVRLNATF